MDTPDNNESHDDHDNNKTSMPIIRFRNYTPQTGFLDGLVTVDQSEPGSIKHLIQDKLNLILDQEDDNEKYRINFDNIEISSKEVCWDLKQRIKKQMDQLESRTDRCIKKHLRQNGPNRANN